MTNWHKKFLELLEEMEGKTGGLTFDGERLMVDAVLEVGDIEIGAVELKNHDTDDRAIINPDGALNVNMVNQTNGARASGSIVVNELPQSASIVGPGDTITLDDGSNEPVTFEFYTSGDYARGSVGILHALADGDTVTIDDGWGVAVTFRFKDVFSEPNDVVIAYEVENPTVVDLEATRDNLKAAIEATALEIDTAVYEGVTNVVYLTNQNKGDVCNIDIVGTGTGLLMNGMSGGVNDELVNVTPGNVPVDSYCDMISGLIENLLDAINNPAIDLDITATTVETEGNPYLDLLNDYQGTMGNKDILYTEFVEGTFEITGMNGGINPSSTVLQDILEELVAIYNSIEKLDAPGTIYSGTVTLPGTLPSQALLDGVAIRAKSTNAGTVMFNSFPLEPGESISVRIDDLSKALVTGSELDIIYYIGS
jgi:hypothetical protein